MRSPSRVRTNTVVASCPEYRSGCLEGVAGGTKVYRESRAPEHSSADHTIGRLRVAGWPNEFGVRAKLRVVASSLRVGCRLLLLLLSSRPALATWSPPETMPTPTDSGSPPTTAPEDTAPPVDDDSGAPPGAEEPDTARSGGCGCDAAGRSRGGLLLLLVAATAFRSRGITPRVPSPARSRSARCEASTHPARRRGRRR
jgi:hypothetical protein